MTIEWEYGYKRTTATKGNYELTIVTGAYDFMWLIEKDGKEVATGKTTTHDTAQSLCYIITEALIKEEYGL